MPGLVCPPATCDNEPASAERKGNFGQDRTRQPKKDIESKGFARLHYAGLDTGRLCASMTTWDNLNFLLFTIGPIRALDYGLSNYQTPSGVVDLVTKNPQSNTHSQATGLFVSHAQSLTT